jgi:tripartite-type tricarboxylate transporter receptor subunit TctC
LVLHSPRVGGAARARPDGYTIDLGYLSTHALNGAFYSLQYNVLNDFAPISLVFTASFVIFAKENTAASVHIWGKSRAGKNVVRQ